jgi:hypothetical protein
MYADQYFVIDDVAYLKDTHRAMIQQVLFFQLFLFHSHSSLVSRMLSGRLHVPGRGLSDAGRMRNPDKIAGGPSGRRFAQKWRGLWRRC